MASSAEVLANVRSFHDEIDSPDRKGRTSNAPLLLVLESTSRCNFRCVHCSQTFNRQARADMSVELFRKTGPAWKTALEVYLFGDGEVLLDIPRHLEMVSQVREANPACSLGFSTNGKLLTPEVYGRYAATGVQYIQVSIDAATRELYDEMRRGGSFDDLIANLEGIAALRRRSTGPQPRLHLATVISRQNYRQLPLLAEFAKRYEFSYWYISAEYFHNPGRGRLRLAAEDLVELARSRAEIVRRYGSHYSVFFDPSIGLRPEARGAWFESKSPVYCTVPWQRFELKANGDVKVCPYFLEPICSVNGKSFAEVWNGPEFRRIRMAFASGTGVPSYCVNCNLAMRKQYVRRYPFPFDPGGSGPLARVIRRTRKLIERI